jgi:hypothetical protein
MRPGLPSRVPSQRDLAKHMNSGRYRTVVWPLLLAAGFFCIPPVLFYLYPFGFWSSTDYEPLGLADALNMAYRLADVRLYPAEGMTGHPGVLFYLMSWLALAISGHPVAAGTQFFRDVVDHVEVYHRASIYIAALVGSLGVYVLARTALKLIPAGATVVALLLWLLSTPATIICFMTTGFEPVALLINGLFLVTLVRLASDAEIDPKVIVLAGFVGAFAYLNKLAYVYVPLALVCAIFWKAVFCRTGWRRGSALIALSVLTFVGVVVATGYFFIGWNAFVALLRFHRNVILGSGLYGTGSQVVVSEEGIRRAIMAIPGDHAYAVPLALIAGAVLDVAGLVAGFRNRQRHSVAVIGIGVGLAAMFSALSVLKHYADHYTAGVSATLPACVVAGCLFAQTWNARARLSALAMAGVLAVLMAGPVLMQVRAYLIYEFQASGLALADMKEVSAQTAGMKRTVRFSYRVPLPQFVEGFVVHYASVPRLTEKYIQTRGNISNEVPGASSTEDIGAYVIQKNIFHDVEAFRNAPNLDPQGPEPARLEAGDRIIEFRTVFMLIRK